MSFGETSESVVIDSSVLLAIVFGEPRARELARLLNLYEERLISAINLTEVAIVATSRTGEDLALDAIGRFDVGCVPVDEELAWEAAATRLRWRRLNLGDAFAVATARKLRMPLATLDDDFRTVPGLQIVP